jgi:CRISPR-associated endoribonuclease Cas6
MPPDLASLVVAVARTSAGPETQDAHPASFTGREVYQWLLGEIQRDDPALARELHDPGRHKPFTASAAVSWPLADSSTSGPASPPPLWFRVTGLAPPLTSWLASLDRARLPTVRIGGRDLSTTLVTTAGSAHPWAAATTYAEVLRAARAAPCQRVTLWFHSPTSFSGNNGVPDTLFPDPGLLVTSLARKWNRHAPVGMRMPDAVLAGLRARTGVTDYGIALDRMDVLGRWQPGFVGQVSFGVAERRRDIEVWLAALARFAFFAGVGQRTTVGMGQVTLA